MFDDCSERIAVGDNDDILVIENHGADSVMPEWEYAVNSGFERLGTWKSILWEACVLLGESWMSFVISAKLWRWDVIRSSPLQYLRFTVFGGGFGLVESLKSTIVPLVQSPVLVVGNPGQIELVGDCVVCLDGSLENGAIANIEMETLFSEEGSSFNGLADSVFGERNIMPSSESVLAIPGRLSVSDEDNSMHLTYPVHSFKLY